MTKFVFNVFTYTNESDFIVATRKQVTIRRNHQQTARMHCKRKFPSEDGFFIELERIITI